MPILCGKIRKNAYLKAFSDKYKNGATDGT